MFTNDEEQGTLSIEDTHELCDILDARDWELLEEFVVRRGYDENASELAKVKADLEGR